LTKATAAAKVEIDTVIPSNETGWLRHHQSQTKQKTLRIKKKDLRKAAGHLIHTGTDGPQRLERRRATKT